LKEGHKLRVLGSKMLGDMFGVKKDEVTGEWRQWHNDELRDLYCTLNIIRVIRSRIMGWVGICSTDGEEKMYIQVFGGET
jgi:hypothetical protein